MTKTKNKKILILDDNYGHYMYKKLDGLKRNYSFSVRGNVLDPMKYYKYIIRSEPDIIIMNTWYKNNNYSLPKGIQLLERLLGEYGKEETIEKKSFFGLFSKKTKSNMKILGMKSKIIYTCDMGKHNLSNFSIFKYFNNIYFVPDRDIQKIVEIIEN